MQALLYGIQVLAKVDENICSLHEFQFSTKAVVHYVSFYAFHSLLSDTDCSREQTSSFLPSFYFPLFSFSYPVALSDSHREYDAQRHETVWSVLEL